MIGRRCKAGDRLSRAALIGRAPPHAPHGRSARGAFACARCAAPRARRSRTRRRKRPQTASGHGGGGTPGPIPNPEVKPPSADCTAGGARGRPGRRWPTGGVRAMRGPARGAGPSLSASRGRGPPPPSVVRKGYGAWDARAFVLVYAMSLVAMSAPSCALGSLRNGLAWLRLFQTVRHCPDG